MNNFYPKLSPVDRRRILISGGFQVLPGSWQPEGSSQETLIEPGDPLELQLSLRVHRSDAFEKMNALMNGLWGIVPPQALSPDLQGRAV